MARRSVLGNDPFERGAALRPELEAAREREEPTPAATVVSTAIPMSPEVIAPPSRKRRPRRPRVAAAPAAALIEAPESAIAVAEPEPEPEPERSAKEIATDVEPEPQPDGALGLMRETTGERLRELFEHRLPDLIDRLGRLATEWLGIVTPPESIPEIDAFGMSQAFVDRWQPTVAFFLNRYFRLQAEGMERIPATGPALLVCNHSGVLPFDEILLKAAVTELHPQGRVLRPLTEDFAIHLPFAGSWLNRFGCVRACPENAERLLGEGQLVGVFPEGSHGIGKLYRNRYRLQRFGRGGFVKLALRAQVPILPMALLGAEEANPVLARINLPRSLGVPYLPVTPTFPWLGPLGLWPLPTRLFLKIGEPIHLGHHPRDAEDRPLVARLAEDVRAHVQELLDGMIAERKSVFL
jgi:1-acyl-sn-glycerol-3-phosphate acyltransferase